MAGVQTERSCDPRLWPLDLALNSKSHRSDPVAAFKSVGGLSGLNLEGIFSNMGTYIRLWRKLTLGYITLLEQQGRKCIGPTVWGPGNEAECDFF